MDNKELLSKANFLLEDAEKLVYNLKKEDRYNDLKTNYTLYQLICEVDLLFYSYSDSFPFLKNVELIKGNSRDKENSEHIVDLLKSFISFLQRSETDKQKLLDVVDC